MSMTFFVCKTCGRAINCDRKPDYCYHDRTTSIENISDEDSIKMGLFLGNHVNFNGVVSWVEFSGDIRFDPFTGEALDRAFGYTLSDYQDKIMKKVVANEG